MYVNERRKTQQTKKGINTMANVKMTERDFYNKVIAHEGIPSDIKEYAMEGIAKLDALFS